MQKIKNITPTMMQKNEKVCKFLQKKFGSSLFFSVNQQAGDVRKSL